MPMLASVERVVVSTSIRNLMVTTMYVLPSSPLTSEVVSKSVKVIRAVVLIVAVGATPRVAATVAQAGWTFEGEASRVGAQAPQRGRVGKAKPSRHHFRPTLTRTRLLSPSTRNF